MCLRRLGQEQVHLGRAVKLRIDYDVLFPIELNMIEGDAHEILDAMSLADADHIIVGVILLQHEPHGPDVIAGKPPVALRLQVAQPHLVIETQLDARDPMSNLASYELQPAPG